MVDFVGESLGLHFWVFVAEIRLSIFSWLVENFIFHVSLLAAQASISRKLFCDFSSRIFTSWCG